MTLDVFDGHQLIGVIRTRPRLDDSIYPNEPDYVWEAFDPEGNYLGVAASERTARDIVNRRARTLRRIEIMQGFLNE